MKRKSLSVLSALLVSMILHAGATEVHSVSAHQELVATRLLVKYKTEVAQKAGPVSFSMIAGIKAKDQKFLRSGVSVISLDDAVAAEVAFESLRQSDAVEYVEYDVPIRAAQTPNDANFSELWGMRNVGQAGGVVDIDINADIAWDHTTGGDVVVGVVDSGVDYTHPDLAANIWVNQAELNGETGVDDDNNGYIDDIHGIDTYNDDSDPMDDNNHGTHVSGTIAAVGNNEIGVTGVNWNAKIVPCKSLGRSGTGYISDAITCMDYFLALKESGVNIVVTNHSWVGPFVQAFNDITELHNDAGILAVAAAGNHGRLVDNPKHSQDVFPAALALPNVISVAAIDRSGQLAGFSNYGHASVHLGAPGVDILSTVVGGGYGQLDGTSMAAPHVSGVIALLNSAHPGIDHHQLKEFVFNTGKPLSSLADVTITGKMLRIEFDNDLDSMPNNWELMYGLNPESAVDKLQDPDGDGLVNHLEFKNNTNPMDSDTDEDGLFDGDEVLVYFSDPNNPDTDGDGLSDGDEVDSGSSPVSVDHDGDGLTDVQELALGTDPNETDSDGDGMADGWEFDHQLNPLEDDSLLDSDNDGYENILEYKAGTRPKDQNSAPSRGSFLWSAEFNDFVSEVALGINDELLVVERGGYLPQSQEWLPGYLVAVDQYGRQIWRRSLGNDPAGVAVHEISQPPLVTPEGDIYLTARSVVQKYDSQGQLIWQRYTVESGNCGVLARALNIDGGLVIMCGSGTTIAFDRDGVERWSASENHGYRSHVAVAGDGASYSAVYGSLVKRNLSGDVLWSTALGDSHTLYSPALSDNMIYVASQGFSVDPEDASASLFGIDYDGTIQWSVKLPEFPTQSPVVDEDGSLYITATNGVVYKYSAQGQPLWSRSLNVNNFRPHVLVDSNQGLYVITGFGNAALSYLGEQEAEFNWVYPFSAIGSSSSPVLLPGRDILVVPSRKQLLAIRHEGYGVAESDWPTYEGSFSRTNNTMVDVDGDLMDDNWELLAGLQVGLNDAVADLDGDGLVNLFEYRLGTIPDAVDSDGDTLSDGDEVTVFLTNPLESDSDHDGLSDSVEVAGNLSDPLQPDTDGDGLSDFEEVTVHQSNPRLEDTDGDTLSDFDEVEYFGSDPTQFDQPFADLDVVLVGNDGGLLKNGLISYRSVVRNRGAFPATNVVMTNTLPEGVAFESATSDLVDCDFTAPLLRCEADSVGVLDGYSVTVTVSTSITEKLPFYAAVEGEGPSDPDTSNNATQAEYGGCGCGETCASPSSAPDPTLPAIALLALGGVFRRQNRHEKV